ncbi:MAG TPA: (deoxy)nucleoside triphosphate pyrophosphohydrolase [Chitinivibrionales bacterium]|nr:(deoxy)nucleoside triphosphate pyrophosphohydrolase [Chitinivibrionales bacterium]
MDQLPHILVACAIIENNGKILAAKRSDAQPHGGKWEFPGGKIGKDEDPDAAIVREIREELGCGIRVINELSDVSFRYPDKSVTLVPLVCEITEATAHALEHDEVRWVDMKEADALDWLPPDKEIMKDYFRMKQFGG